MMMIPRKNSLDIFDSIFDDPFFESEPRKGRRNEVMKTDIKEKNGNYILKIDLPGYNKEDIKIELENGYLTVHAAANETVDEEEKDGYIYKERFVGECSRSFYAGDNLKQEDIKASYKNGTLTLEFPKEETKEVETKKFIEIE